MYRRFVPYLVAILVTMLLTTWFRPFDHLSALAQSDCQTFPETGKTACGRFLEYWQKNGGLSQQGFPISDLVTETSPTDGKIYQMQYFERAVFEMHPENAAPNDVLLSLLGKFEYDRRHPEMPPVGPEPTFPAALTPIGGGVKVPLSRDGVTIYMNKDTGIGTNCEVGLMVWSFTIENNNPSPFSIELDRNSVVQVDSTGKTYSPAPNCSKWTFHGDVSGQAAFMDPTVIASGESAVGVVNLDAKDIPAGAEYLDLKMRVSGTPLVFRFPLK